MKTRKGESEKGRAKKGRERKREREREQNIWKLKYGTLSSASLT
jgi:hypothetical protein